MSKTLIVGDIHCHFQILEAVKKLIPKYDKVIFMGDYVDDWNTPPEASLNALTELKNLYEQNLGKIVPLLANHEAFNLFPQIFGPVINKQTSIYVQHFMHTFLPIFRLAHAQDGLLFTHAGVTRTWADKYLPQDTTPSEFADDLNKALHHWEDSDKYEKIFLGLAEVGSGRGGKGIPSPIWADINELLADPVPELNQVVGHTPVCTVLQYQSYGAKLYFCDTHSTFSNGTPIGDNSLLELENGIISPVSLDGKKFSW